ncbi:tyrosine-type recombinase/integrase [Sphingobium fuliginis]|uniref:Mobile element protein n=1 Tax=Sphingobium fuliginis (strain ATCC 27551) TaxID=336203 RepID=A0A292ZER7_SPHSA|nr:tyrosine-type recombinase/integrase [Sphingobium fuliginis]GAY21977.1 mobile element protein [Sphingobium fuliginis]
MARIVRALPGYGDIQAGFPVIVDERMAIIEPAFAYLHELATVPGRSHAVETIRTYGEHLHDWFDSLEQSQIAWAGVGEREIAAWRNRMLECPSPHTKRPYARSTINDRVRTVCRFYGWAHQRGWIEDLPFHFIDVRVRHQRPSMLAHHDVRPGVVAANVLTVPEAERLPRALRADQLRRHFSALAPPYDLMASWALVTGMRRKELCALELFQVPETAHLDAGEHPLIGIGLSITKGGVPRTVYPPIRLLDATHRYIDEVRGPLIRRLRRADRSWRAPSALFLTSRGAAVSPARFTAAMAAAFKAAGVVGTGHWLRHCFAMTMLAQLQRQARTTPEINPLKVVQVLLGHRSIASTAIYLRCVEMHAAELEESVAWLYGALIGDG